MGHVSFKIIIDALKAGAWTMTGVTTDQVANVMDEYKCPVCLLAKKNQTRVHFSITDPTTIPIAGLVSGDIIGPITPIARDGSKYFFLFVDRRTSYYHVTTSKSKDGFITALKYVYEWYLSHGHTIKAFRSDSENIMVHGEVADFLQAKVVDQQYSLPYAHYQNLVERHVQTVVNAVGTIIHDQPLLGNSFWDYALFYVIDVKNHTPNTKTNGKTPLQMITNKEPIDFKRDFLFPFGQPVAARIPKRTWRFDLKSELGIYLGRSKGSIGGGLVYFPSTKAILPRGDLIPLDLKPEEFKRYENIGTGEKPSLIDLTFEIPGVLADVEMEKREEELNIPLPGIPMESNRELESSRPIEEPISRSKFKKLIRKLGVETRAMKKLSALVMNSKHGKKKKEHKSDELSQALASAERDEWIKALKQEVDSLLETTKSIIPETPDKDIDYDIIYATTALKKKLHADGTVDKYKVRIPVCGNQLKNKWDYNNPTYSPTVSMITHTSMLQMSIHDEMHMATYDTVSAYLHQVYPSNLKPLYLKFPRHLAIACGINPDQYYRIKKYMYGLPDAGRAYYLAYSKVLVENDYTMSMNDPCLFYRFDDKEGIRTYAWIHVDDTFVSSTHQSELKRFEDIIGAVYPITANYDVSSHLGISLNRNEDGSITLSQNKLLQQLFDEYPSSKRHSKYPAIPRNQQDEEEIIDINDDDNKFRRLLGQLLYLTITRPDIIPSVSYNSAKCTSWNEDDYDDLLLIVSYLRQTPERCLTIYPKRKGDDGSFNLTAYVDAAYMSHRDAASHTGYCIALGSMNPQSFIINKSSKQKCIATSSTHAEIRALYDLTINIVYLISLFEEVKRPIQLPAIVYEDNQSTIDLVSSTTTRIGKSKHYLMLIQYIREQVRQNLIQVNKVDGNKNLANMMTKIFASKEYFDSISQIMGLQDRRV